MSLRCDAQPQASESQSGNTKHTENKKAHIYSCICAMCTLSVRLDEAERAMTFAHVLQPVLCEGVSMRALFVHGAVSGVGTCAVAMETSAPPVEIRVADGKCKVSQSNRFDPFLEAFFLNAVPCGVVRSPSVAIRHQAQFPCGSPGLCDSCFLRSPHLSLAFAHNFGEQPRI